MNPEQDDETFSLKNLEKRKISPVKMKIKLINENLKSLDGIEKYSCFLTHLNLRSNQISSLKPLRTCKNLAKVNISDNPSLKTLDGLESLISLVYLGIAKCSISSLKQLRNCTELLDLECSGNHIESFDGLQNCLKLDQIDASNNYKLRSIKGLPNVAYIYYHLLYAENTPLNNIWNLRHILHSQGSNHDRQMELVEASGTAKFKKIRENLDREKFYISWLFLENTIKLYDFF